MVKMKFNCSNIYNCSIFYRECANDFSEICKQMEEISTEIATSWKGKDSDIYINQYNNYIKYLKNISVFLTNKSLLLDKAASLHNDVDNELCNQFKRSKVDEPKDRY